MTDKKVNEADVIWEELRNLPIDMFALPNQRVENHLLRVRGIPGQLYLKPKAPAALPAFETLLNAQVILRVERTAEGDLINVQYPKYVMEETDFYMVVRRFVPPKERVELLPTPVAPPPQAVSSPLASKVKPTQSVSVVDGMVVVSGDIDSSVPHTPLASKVKPRKKVKAKVKPRKKAKAKAAK